MNFSADPDSEPEVAIEKAKKSKGKKVKEEPQEAKKVIGDGATNDDENGEKQSGKQDGEDKRDEEDEQSDKEDQKAVKKENGEVNDGPKDSSSDEKAKKVNNLNPFSPNIFKIRPRYSSCPP